ncbi:hypothetical protein K491DRAFT_88530 [Lophiostoma macrostomum CBS 122681]|uniref:Uncharacterized protein n=1 Tax=Lophiostoma macrostomum CBS 122681 TaxID=1314788 RepID=A0A6A6SVD4_9PLEO|nr:hypothetical protein K491DRAFT_88530 [Lophiostoma macrostomum CBS 122681]
MLQANDRLTPPNSPPRLHFPPPFPHSSSNQVAPGNTSSLQPRTSARSTQPTHRSGTRAFPPPFPPPLDAAAGPRSALGQDLEQFDDFGLSAYDPVRRRTYENEGNWRRRPPVDGNLEQLLDDTSIHRAHQTDAGMTGKSRAFVTQFILICSKLMFCQVSLVTVDSVPASEASQIPTKSTPPSHPCKLRCADRPHNAAAAKQRISSVILTQ